MADSYGKSIFGILGRKVLYHYRKIVEDALEKSHHFQRPIRIDEIAKNTQEVISLGAQCGEGWLLAGEIGELVDSGVENIVCLQPFGCLPNHIVGKGVMKPLREKYQDINIISIDYDPGASEVNQLNRIKLMMSVAHEKLTKERRSQDDKRYHTCI